MDKAGPREPKSLSLLYGGMYWRKLVGHVKGLEKYECVSWKAWIRLSRIGGGCGGRGRNTCRFKFFAIAKLVFQAG